MTCRHKKGDPDCSSTVGGRAWLENKEAQIRYQERRKLEAETPDSEKFTILDHREIGEMLALRVEYPNCKKCSYEGVKVMVFDKATIADALYWKKIDPHFTDPKTVRPKTEAPGPIARFPGSDAGWKLAQAFMVMLTEPQQG
jgi:hypothetical protein